MIDRAQVALQQTTRDGVGVLDVCLVARPARFAAEIADGDGVGNRRQ
jgi:hypothetical protein